MGDTVVCGRSSRGRRREPSLHAQCYPRPLLSPKPLEAALRVAVPLSEFRRIHELRPHLKVDCYVGGARGARSDGDGNGNGGDQGAASRRGWTAREGRKRGKSGAQGTGFRQLGGACDSAGGGC